MIYSPSIFVFIFLSNVNFRTHLHTYTSMIQDSLQICKRILQKSSTAGNFISKTVFRVMLNSIFFLIIYFQQVTVLLLCGHNSSISMYAKYLVSYLPPRRIIEEFGYNVVQVHQFMTSMHGMLSMIILFHLFLDYLIP